MATARDAAEGTVYVKNVGGRDARRTVYSASDRVQAIFDGFTPEKAAPAVQEKPATSVRSGAKPAGSSSSADS